MFRFSSEWRSSQRRPGTCGIGTRSQRPELSESPRFIPSQASHPPLSKSREATRQLPGKQTTPPSRDPLRRADHGALPECRARIEGVPLRPVVTTLNEKVAVEES